MTNLIKKNQQKHIRKIIWKKNTSKLHKFVSKKEFNWHIIVVYFI
jgi:hypothetical protein